MAQHITTIQEIRDRTVAQEQHISDDDLLPFDHGTGSNRHRAFTVAEIIEYIKANKLDGMTIGTTSEIKTSSGNPVIVNFYAIDAGTIEAKKNFKVGDSEWVHGNHHPTISGLYGLEAGNVGTTNLQADTIDSHSKGVNVIQVLKKLVGDQGQSALSNALLLGATRADSLVVDGNAEVSGDLTVDGVLSIVGTLVSDGGFSTNNGDFSTSNGSVSAPNGTVTAGKLKIGSGSTLVANSAGSESAITTQLQALASGTVAVIINKHSAALQFSDTFYPIGTWQVPAGGAAQVIVHGDGDSKKCYPMVGTYV